MRQGVVVLDPVAPTSPEGIVAPARVPIPPQSVDRRDLNDWDLPTPAVPVTDTPVGGRLGRFWRNWSIVEDPFVTNVLRQGYRLPLAALPPLTSTPTTDAYSPHQLRPLHDSPFVSLLRKEAIEIVHDPARNPGFYSPVFLVPKKGTTSWRMIHNLSTFNRRYLERPPYFRMTTLRLLRTRITAGDSLISLDIQDAYLHVPIHPNDRRFPRFFFNGTLYQWAVLPFGISTAPWLFTRITRPVAAYLHLRNINFDPYIDDCLLNNRDSTLLLRHRDFTLRLFNQLGWIVNQTKSELTPSFRLQFIGGLFLTDQDLLQVPRDRWLKILAHLFPALQQARTLRQWQVLLGLLTSAQDLTARGRLQLRPIQRFLAPFIRQQDPESLIVLLVHLHPFLRWWTVESNVCGGVSLTALQPSLHLFVASKQGWGAHLGTETVAGLWSGDRLHWHSNNLELEALIRPSPSGRAFSVTLS
ncbi:uncharacterized protein [Haliotis cracherodii]|uniref:uncharacterized protein n=1 Tax=Haliotis cracherodii TaxID=6455 RepID=UPI0039EA6048